MCKAKDEGPRCSHGGRVRYERAEKYKNKIQEKADSELARRGELSTKTQWQVDNAERRMRQATVVRDATPAGWGAKEGEIEIHAQIVENLKPMVESGHRAARLEVARHTRKINQLNKQAEKGRSDRATMRANKRILETLEDGRSEKKALRDKMIAQGAQINERAQKALPETAANNKNLDNDKPLTLREWSKSELRDNGLARSWVEDGTDSGWEKNNVSRPLAKGTRVGDSVTKRVRMNTPDGMVAEAKLDVHTVKTPEGKFTVEARLTSASTNLQSSPYDTTGGELGDLISSRKGLMARGKVVSSETFDTQAAAEKAAKRVQRAKSQTLAVDLAYQTRETLRTWAAKGHGEAPLMRENQKGAHLYSKEATPKA